MIHFDCDYMCGAHPDVLAALVRTNAEQTPGYGADPHTARASNLVRQAFGVPDAEVWLMVGGTQTNATILDALLRHTEGVIATETSHIAVHESGAIELFGHKVITLPGCEGKLQPEAVQHYLEDFHADATNPHMVTPAAVYISFPTELGTLYSLSELRALRQICDRYQLPLYIDGARLGYGLAASTDVDAHAIAQLADVFYVGGTKMGTLFGEAVVCTRPQLLRRFFTMMKAHGAVLAKGRLLGVQFEAMFEPRADRPALYWQIAEGAVRRARRLRDIMTAHGYDTFIDSPTNQQFFVLPNTVIDALLPHVSFEYWGPRGETASRVRFVTSWETTDEDITTLDEALASLS